MFLKLPQDRYRFSLVYALVFFTSALFSQGLISKLNTLDLLLKFRNSSLKPVYNVSVRVESPGLAEKTFSSLTDSNSRVQFVFDKLYAVFVSSENYSPLKIIVDTRFKEKKGKLKINKDKSGLVKLFFTLDLFVPMCVLQRMAPQDTSACARIFFDPKTNAFVLDSTYRMNGKTEISDDPCSVFLARSLTDTGSALNRNLVDYNAKLVYGQKKSSLVDQGLHLKDSSGEVIQSTKTDLYGHFSFKKIDPHANFNIVLDKNLKSPSGEKVYLIDAKDIESKEIKKNESNESVYDLLSTELLKLTENNAEGTAGKIEKFKAGNEKELTLTEPFFYAPGEWKVSKANERILDNLLQALILNEHFRLEIYSHTDAVGNAQMNIELSNKRAKAIVDLFVGKGIRPERLKGQGFGATRLLNRCKEGVTCSEKENQVNRRTEFKLIKNE